MKKPKYSYEYIKKYFEDNDCELLTTEYKGENAKLSYKCICKNIVETKFSQYNKSKKKKCMICTGVVPKFTFKYVKNFFEDNGCELLETKYKNSNTKMSYLCICKNQSTINFSKFKQGQRCMNCSGNKKYTFDFVKNFFEDNKCELLDTKYINIDNPLKYKCICNNISTISFYSFKNGVRCMKCANNERFSYVYVYNFFKDKNCTLLNTEYINNSTKMKYICKCGNISETTFAVFKKGHLCKNCGYIKQENNAKTYKNYTMPSGKIIRIQGYENLALDEIVKIYKEVDIITNRNEMPIIYYKQNGKKLRYYPDIYIKSKNIIIEIKSQWTYKLHLIKNILKSLATRKLNYEYEIWIYNNNKQKIII